MDLSVHVAEVLAVRALGAAAEAEEVGNGAWGQVVKEFEVDNLLHAVEGKLHLSVLASLTRVDHLLELVGSKAVIDDAN